MTRTARQLAVLFHMMAVTTTLLPLASANASEMAQPEKAIHCSIRVSVSSFEPDDCVVTAAENLITVEWGKNPSFKVSLQRQTDDSASLVVSGIDLRSPNGLQLGDVAYNNTSGCWEGNGNKICYTLQSEIDEEIEGDRAEYGRAGNEPPSAANQAGDLASSLAGATAVSGMMCWLTKEDLRRPGNRAMMRAMAGRDVSDRVLQWKSFTLAANGELLVDGLPARVLSRDGNIVVANVWNGVTRSRLPSTYSAEHQKSWQEGQDFFQALGEGLAQSSGIDQRVYVLDFGSRSGQLATVENNALIEQQQILCQ